MIHPETRIQALLDYMGFEWIMDIEIGIFPLNVVLLIAILDYQRVAGLNSAPDDHS